MDNTPIQPSDQQGSRPYDTADQSVPTGTVTTGFDQATETLEPLQQGAMRQSEVVVVYQRESWRKVLVLAGFAFLVVLLLVGVAFVVLRRRTNTAPVRSGTFGSVRLPLGQIAKSDQSGQGTVSSVAVNGQLTVGTSVVLTPALKPATPAQGETYYDKATNQLLFYNGTEFINLGASVQNISNVTNIINGGTTVIATSSGGTVTANGGVAGTVPKFTGSQELGPSIITDNGSSVSVGGNLNLVTPSSEPRDELTVWPDNPTPGTTASSDLVAVEVGMKIHTDVSGLVKGIRFYKGAPNVGTHTGHLWNTSGNLLGSVTFTNETATGWQEARFAAPVAISAETTYIVSYHAPSGRYAFDDNYFSANEHANDVLHAFRNGEDGANGVFRYGATPVFPSTGFNGANYWVDVIFQPNPPPSRFLVNGAQLATTDLANNGDIAKRGASQVFTGNNTFRSSVTSGVAFSIQNTSGIALLQADTQSDRLYVGPTTGDPSGILLVLGTRTNGGDPAGVDGGIYYNSALHMFRCYRHSVWGPCANLEVDGGFTVYDEFMGGQVTSLSSNSIIGSLGWHAQAIGANGNINFNPTTPTPVADRPGVMVLQTPAVANQGTTFMLANSNGPSMLLQAGNTVRTAIGVGAITGQVLRVGLHTQTSSTTQPVTGVWWEADPAVHPRWQYCYGDGTTATCLPSAFTITADTWFRTEIRVITTGVGTSTVDFGINGTFYTVSNATLDTTNRLSPAYSCFTTVATAQNCYWDYFEMHGTASTSR